MIYKIHSAIFALLGAMFAYQQHAAAQVPFTLAAYWFVDNRNPSETLVHFDPAVHVEFIAAVGVHVVPDQRRDGLLVAR
jgi:hypothetical protein